MQATRDVLAEGERNTGTSEAERIRTQGNTGADKIRAFANQRAEEIRARGEREAAKYLEQMGEDPELAIFLVQLDTLERTLSRNATIVLNADEVAPFHLANPRTIAASAGIPVPGSGHGRAEATHKRLRAAHPHCRQRRRGRLTRLGPSGPGAP